MAVRVCLGASCPWDVSLLLGIGGTSLGCRANPMYDRVGTEVLRLGGGRGMGGLLPWEALLVLGRVAGGRSPSSVLGAVGVPATLPATTIIIS